MDDLTPEEAEVLSHSLGLNRGKIEYRNAFVAEPGHSDWSTLSVLVGKGLMVGRPYVAAEGCTVFHVTDAGKAAIRQQIGGAGKEG